MSPLLFGPRSRTFREQHNLAMNRFHRIIVMSGGRVQDEMEAVFDADERLVGASLTPVIPCLSALGSRGPIQRSQQALSVQLEEVAQGEREEED
jgi:hypothetical protein